MSYTAKELLKLALNYDNVATRALLVMAAKKEKKKLDPKAKDKKILKKKKKKNSEYYDTLMNKFAQAITKEDLLERLNAYTNELPAKKSRNADNDAKKRAYDEAMKYMPQAVAAAQKDDFNTAYNNLSYSSGIIDKSGVTDPSFSQYAGTLLTRISDYRKQVASAPAAPAAPSDAPANSEEQKYWDDKAKTQTQQPAGQTGQPVARPKSKWPPIDTAFQTMLGVSPDGSLGPMTQSALEMFKKSVGLPYGKDEVTRRTDSNKNNQQAFNMLKQMPAYKNRSKLEYDENSDVYKMEEL